MKSEVAEAAIQNGANIINDVTAGLHDPNMFTIAVKYGVPIVLNHTRGTAQDMITKANYPKEQGSVTSQVVNELKHRIKVALNAGVLPCHIIIDPGIGFAKQNIHSLELLSQLTKPVWKDFVGKYFTLVGPSRKRFISEIINNNGVEERDWGTAAVVTACVLAGIDIVRVHNVKKLWDVVRVANAIKTAQLLS
eukprot:TRINITY_DN7912_c0_g1_i2.p1 TRINITY_DN7912_c0_g1~~TRINITY_DN7912_c0_g1_i2.p1  ORF type:complete len:193 (+),score=33.24 TRINITY_DN7912_c0_g1_i2:181-759(+)